MNLPDWLQPYKDAWDGWVKMRQTILKKPLTPRAEVMAIHKLEELIQQGFDPKEVLEQSEFNNWQGLFPVYGQQPQTVLRDQNGNKYRVTSDGMRQYVQ